MKKSLHSRMRIFSIILGVITGASAALFPLYRLFLKPELVFKMLSISFFFFGLTMLCVIIFILTSPQLLSKLTALPVAYGLGMTLYMNHKLNVINRFKLMLGIDVGLESVQVDIYKSLKLGRGRHKNISAFDSTKAQIIHVVDTHLEMNNIRVYKLTLLIPYYEGESYEVTKEFQVPNHMLHEIAIGKNMSVLINPNDRNDVYIQTHYGVI